MFERIGRLKVPVQAINDVLGDPIIKVLQDAVTSAYRAKPEKDLTNFDYDRLLVALGTLEDRVRESQEIVGFLAVRTAGHFFEKYFDNTITGGENCRPNSLKQIAWVIACFQSLRPSGTPSLTNTSERPGTKPRSSKGSETWLPPSIRK